MLPPLVFLLLPVFPAPQDAEHEAWSWKLGAGWRLTVAPEVIYPTYVADPRRPTFSITRIDASESDIAGAGDSRYGVRMGTRYGIVQLHPGSDPAGGVQVAGDIAFLGQFDRDNSTDNLGWDGLYGFHLAWRAHPDLVLRLGMAHDSSHLGDEFIESTGRQRIGYTRQEFLAGMRYSPLDLLCGYVEYGRAYDLGNEDLMEEGRAQLGLELESKARLWDRRLTPFAALDVSAYEEDDWDENVSLQVGLARRGAGPGGPWRVGLEFYDGRSLIGEFFQERERFVALAFWLDL